MSYIPTYKLYASNGVTLVYTFPLVQNINEEQDPTDFVEVDGLRGVGSIIIPGSESSFDLSLDFVLRGDDYEDVMSDFDTLQSTIVKFTPYVLKVGRTSTTTKDFNVKRIQPISINNTVEGRRVRTLKCTCTFLALAW